MVGRGKQRPLFESFPGTPTWDDVQKGRAVAVHHDAYTRDCTKRCMWESDISDGKCLLFAKKVIDGKCPSTISLEWSWL